MRSQTKSKRTFSRLVLSLCLAKPFLLLLRLKKMLWNFIYLSKQVFFVLVTPLCFRCFKNKHHLNFTKALCPGFKWVN